MTTKISPARKIQSEEITLRPEDASFFNDNGSPKNTKQLRKNFASPDVLRTLKKASKGNLNIQVKVAPRCLTSNKKEKDSKEESKQVPSNTSPQDQVEEENFMIAASPIDMVESSAQPDNERHFSNKSSVSVDSSMDSFFNIKDKEIGEEKQEDP